MCTVSSFLVYELPQSTHVEGQLTRRRARLEDCGQLECWSQVGQQQPSITDRSPLSPWHELLTLRDSSRLRNGCSCPVPCYSSVSHPPRFSHSLPECATRLLQYVVYVCSSRSLPSRDGEWARLWHVGSERGAMSHGALLEIAERLLRSGRAVCIASDNDEQCHTTTPFDCFRPREQERFDNRRDQQCGEA